ncbi:hypothetical protein D3C86_1790130 [compost metagenome]
MVTAGDEHLLPEHPVSAIDHGPGAGAQVAQGRTLAGFGQGHGAAETPLQHRREEALSQLGAGKTLHQIGGTDAEEGIRDCSDIGRIEIRHAGTQQHFRQL